MKHLFMAAGLSALTATTAFAQSQQNEGPVERAIDNVQVMIFGDADECIVDRVNENFELLADATARGDDAISFTIAPDTMQLIKSECEAQTETEATAETAHLMQGFSDEVEFSYQ